MKRLPLFAEFSESELALLLDLAEPELYPDGMEIVKQGGDGGGMFLIADGHARVILNHGPGTEVELRRLRAGDFFGELSLVDKRPRSADVYAVGDCVVLRVTNGLMRKFAAEDPRGAFKLAMAVLGVVGARLRAANGRYLESLSIVSVLSEGASVMRMPAMSM